MSESANRPASATGRREPPPFRMLTVRRKEQLSVRMIRVTLAGDELRGLEIDEPAASVRLLIPAPGDPKLEVPKWNGNEFLNADGSRPLIRTFTPRRFDATALELELDMVIHEGGAVSQWATAVTAGSVAAVSGPGRGYSPSPDAAAFVLAGDETAIPAISQLLEDIPADFEIQVYVEIATPAAQLVLPGHPLATVSWHVLPPGAAPGSALLPALERAEFPPETQVWCAGEAAAMHAIRNHLFKQRGLARSQATVRGYWKAGR
ncbi:MAG: siderophore-interacting protein [Acidimicrobiia bacterium]|nr:siderophore-interacting protein [Acidimicrobiia bacterium]